MEQSDSSRDFPSAASAVPVARAWPEWMPRLAFAPEQTPPRGDALVVVFLRGAADGLNMVVPHAEDRYYAVRPLIGIPSPGDLRAHASQRALDLDGFFGFHPALEPLLPAWQSGHLAAVHACGAPDDSRSHFKAMELMERGVSDARGPASGWIGRHLASLNAGNHSPLRAVGIGETMPRSLRGAVPVSALRSIADFHLSRDRWASVQMQAVLGSLYEGQGDLETVGRETLEILRTLEVLDPLSYQPAVEAHYPSSAFGMGLSKIAMLIKAEVGLEVAAIDLGGWDTHFAQGGSDGHMASLLSNLGQGLAALHADLFAFLDSLTVVVMSEFGRRVTENASLGTDHGHGSLLLLMGGNVLGGKVHADWPGLEEEQLYGPGDLAVTIDYRDVLAEVCSKRLNNQALEEIFPDFEVTVRGVVK